MTARAAAPLASLVATLLLGACTSFYEIPVETPIQPKLDVSSFDHVLVAGFVTGGSEEVDTNLETVRLLRSQLRQQGRMNVIEAEVVPLTEALAGQTSAAAKGEASAAAPKTIADEKDLEAYAPLFANEEYWKKLGEEFKSPLIVTGTVLFTPHARSSFVQRTQDVIDEFGRRVTQPTRTFMERKGYILRPRFVFIDGRTGKTLYTETFREEVLYNPQQESPALSAYFELMDRLLPGFIGTLSSQKIRGTRVLLK